MYRWFAAIGLSLAVCIAVAQEDELAKANALFKEGKRLDALPLYEDLAKAHPNDWVIVERLADCLTAKSAQSSDPKEVRALRIRIRDTAKRAIELGDTAEFIKMMANIDPDAPIEIASASPASALLQAAEKAFTAGDFATAMVKYGAAADADPKLYEAPLYAGDTAFVQKDLKTAGIWFARAIAVNPDRETAYRYWGDALMRYGGDPIEAKEKFISAIVAEPYNKLAWQGLQQWAQTEKAVLMTPKIDRPMPPVSDPKKPNNITIQFDALAGDDKQHPGASAWLMYSLIRASYRGDQFKKNFPNEKEYRHSLMEEDAALSMVASTVEEKKIKPEKLDESLRNLVELNHAGMLDCWILISAADNGIGQDYEVYRKDHRQLLHDYLAKFVVHGGVNMTQKEQ